MKDEQLALLQLVRTGLGYHVPPPSEIRDWDVLYDLSLRQGVFSIVFDGYIILFEAGLAPEMPSVVKKKWIAASYFDEISFSRQRQAAIEVAHMFVNSGIKTYVLKGAVFAECYPVAAHRRSSDMDCFLMSENGHDDAFEEGNRLIERMGIRVVRSYYKNSSFVYNGLHVENHRFLTPFRGNTHLTELERFFQEMIQNDRGCDHIGDTALLRPPVLVSALFLIEHAYSHFFPESLPVRFFLDWIMFRRRYGDLIDFEDFNRHIDKFGFRKFYDAFEGVGRFIVGEIDQHELTYPMKRMLDDMWMEDASSIKDYKGIRKRLAFARNNFNKSWKYRLYAPYSAFKGVWIKTKGYLFMKKPRIS